MKKLTILLFCFCCFLRLIGQEKLTWENTIQEHISIMSYSLLVENLRRAGDNTEDIPDYIDLFNLVYAKKIWSLYNHAIFHAGVLYQKR